MDKIIKAFPVVSKTLDVDAGIYEAVISTEAVDRQGDIVRAAGVILDNYFKNPVVLWAHDYSAPPVARALGIEVVSGGLRARFQFPEWGVSEQADVVRRLWGAGFLNATSIGFVPIEVHPLGNEVYGPTEYLQWELLEFSIVPVPANQEALRLAIKALVASPTECFGTVLSARNQEHLRQASKMLQDVLNQLENTTSDEQANEKTSEAEPPNTEYALNAESTVELDRLAEALTGFLNNFPIITKGEHHV